MSLNESTNLKEPLIQNFGENLNNRFSMKKKCNRGKVPNYTNEVELFFRVSKDNLMDIFMESNLQDKGNGCDALREVERLGGVRELMRRLATDPNSGI